MKPKKEQEHHVAHQVTQAAVQEGVGEPGDGPKRGVGVMVLRPALGETVGLARGESVALGAPACTHRDDLGAYIRCLRCAKKRAAQQRETAREDDVAGGRVVVAERFS